VEGATFSTQVKKGGGTRVRRTVGGTLFNGDTKREERKTEPYGSRVER